MQPAVKIRFEIHGDDRGSLVVLEEQELPFAPVRVFYMFGTKKDVRRGIHAHKTCNELLICTSGSCRVLLDDGYRKETVFLDRPDEGVYVPCHFWREMYDFSEDAVLMAMADKPYDTGDYIRDYGDFIRYYGIDRGHQRAAEKK